MLRLSYTAVSAYEKCPLSYRFQYVDGIEVEPTPHLSFGRSLHSVLEWFYGRGVPEPPTLDELLAYLDTCWSREGYTDAEEERSYLDQAREVLTRYYRDNAADFRLPVAVEQRFEMELDGYLLAGVIDRIDRHPEGGFEIIDYKTNRRLPELSRLREDLQLPIYQMACREVLGINASKLTFHYLMAGRRYTTRPFDETALDRIRERLLRTAEGVAHGEFRATPNRLCPWCSYLDICPEMAPGRSKQEKLRSRRLSLQRRREALERLLVELEEEMRVEGISWGGEGDMPSEDT